MCAQVPVRGALRAGDCGWPAHPEGVSHWSPIMSPVRQVVKAELRRAIGSDFSLQMGTLCRELGHPPQHTRQPLAVPALGFPASTF